MFYHNIKDYAPEKFKRLTGVSKEVFALMCDTLVAGLPAFGRPPELCLEDRLLLVLMYWREYRTQEHIGETYGVSEATVCRTIKQFEDLLIKDKRFHLPGKKALRASDTVFEIVLLDATECACERPKKNSVATTRARRSATPTKPKSSPTSARAR
jgi:Helix-turn-helix of DDE superfamily endonuclease